MVIKAYVECNVLMCQFVREVCTGEFARSVDFANKSQPRLYSSKPILPALLADVQSPPSLPAGSEDVSGRIA